MQHEASVAAQTQFANLGAERPPTGKQPFRQVGPVLFRVNQAGHCTNGHDLGYTASNKWGYNVRCRACPLQIHYRWTDHNRGMARPALMGQSRFAVQQAGI